MATRKKSTGTGYFSRTSINKRVNATVNGRVGRQAYTSGARSVNFDRDNVPSMRQAWNSGENIGTYTRTSRGRLSANGKDTRGALTHTQTNRDMNGNLISQSGRSKLANRRQRDYDVRQGFNNISPKVIETWRRMGLIDETGNGTGAGGTLRINADGTGSLGLAAG